MRALLQEQAIQLADEAMKSHLSDKSRRQRFPVARTRQPSSREEGPPVGVGQEVGDSTSPPLRGASMCYPFANVTASQEYLSGTHVQRLANFVESLLTKRVKSPSGAFTYREYMQGKNMAASSYTLIKKKTIQPIATLVGMTCRKNDTGHHWPR